MRDDFPLEVKRNLAARVGYACCNPDCRALTTGPRDDGAKAVNLGVAAHITSAAEGGPRFNPNLTAEERGGIENGIWLCQNCAHHIDTDLTRFTEALIRAWKLAAEDRARYSLGKTAPALAEKPVIELHLEIEDIAQATHSRDPVRRFLLGLKNVKMPIAKFPGIRFSYSCGLGVDMYGIDGSHGFGLPQSPTMQGWVSFRGGIDHVIHGDQTVMITRLNQIGEDKDVEGIKVSEYPNLFQRGKPTHHRWVFKPIHFTCEISAEGIPTVTAEKEFPEDDVVWPHRH